VTASGYALATSGISTNYSLSAQPSVPNQNITAAGVTITGVTAASKTYDGTATAVLSGGSVSGTFNGDNVTFTAGTGMFGSQYVGTWPVTASGYALATSGISTNYSLSAQPSVPNQSITAAGVTITGVTAASKTYDGTATAALSGGAVSGTFNSDNVLFTAGTGAFGSQHFGTWPVTASGYALSTRGISTNYSLSTQPTVANASIAAKPLTVTGLSVPASKVYDGTTNTAAPGTPGLLPAEAPAFNTGGDGTPYTGDTVSLSGSATGGYNSKDVGAATVTFTGLSTANTDYTITAPTQAATITPKPLNYTGISVTNKVYDGTSTATLSGTAATLATETGTFGTGGDGAPYTGDMVSFTTGTLTGTFATNQAGIGIAVTLTGGVSLTPGGQSGDYSAGSPSPALTASILQATSCVGASSSENPSGFQDSISFTATLPADATGSVVFASTNGVFSSNSVSGASTISLAITNLPRGTNLITVAYSGDNNYLPSTTNLDQIITNHPPMAATMTVTRTAGLPLVMSLADLATNWSDADGDTVELTGVTMLSTNGVALVALNWTTNLDGSISTTNGGAYIGYPNSPNVADQISYAIGDGQGGTNIGYINIVINSSVTATNSITGISTGGTNLVNAYGIPGYNYILERTTNLAPAIWIDVSTNTAATNGVINAADAFSDLGGTPPASAYYRLKWQP